MAVLDGARVVIQLVVVVAFEIVISGDNGTQAGEQRHGWNPLGWMLAT
jgi:hypothetical protein